MSEYQAPLRDMQFVLTELADLASIAALEGYGDATPDLVDAVLEQAGIFANEVISPLNRLGDEHGTRIENGAVVSPPGYVEAYRQFVENGWQGLCKSVEYDGQGLPYLLHTAVAEMWNSANLSFALCPLLTNGAAEAIEQHGSDDLKRCYLPRMISGEWSGTMNLTEPQAGTDLAAIRTRAEREGDHYRIFGQKIFITWGEHGLTDNIVHLVLARLSGAPEGVKGISLFLVPKFLLDDDGGPGERNDVRVVSVESKLGIHSSPTCVMSYGENDGAIGYLVGEENNGLACMFTMMNEARHSVGMQGVAMSERALQRAVAYAKERLQGFAPGVEGRAPIIHHPDVRRMLMQMRALTEASRAMGYVAAAAQDFAQRSASEAERGFYQKRLDLLIPVVKAWCTEMSQEVTTLGVQVHGGMGFIEETGAAQYMRDARILTIYEGTTGIQALDLIGRKLLRDGGDGLSRLVAEMRAIDERLGNSGLPDDVGENYSRALTALEDVAAWFLGEVSKDPVLGGAISVNFTMMLGNVVGAWLMLKAALAALARVEAGEGDRFHAAKIRTAIFFCEHILPRSEALAVAIRSGADGVMGIDVEDF